MKKSYSILLIFFITLAVLVGVVGSVSAVDFCPNSASLAGYWNYFTPSNRLCSQSYYTYNTTSLGDEESWYITDAMYVMCSQAAPPLGPTYYHDIESMVYIPSPHLSQTSSAHYYRWKDSLNYGMIGNVNQYGTFGWANLSTTSYSFLDRWKLSDWTNEGLYSKTVDLDAFSISNCP